MSGETTSNAGRPLNLQILDKVLVLVSVDQDGNKLLVDSSSHVRLSERFAFHLFAVATPIGSELHQNQSPGIAG